jgi:hypothetical protein
MHAHAQTRRLKVGEDFDEETRLVSPSKRMSRVTGNKREICPFSFQMRNLYRQGRGLRQLPLNLARALYARKKNKSRRKPTARLKFRQGRLYMYMVPKALCACSQNP